MSLPRWNRLPRMRWHLFLQNILPQVHNFRLILHTGLRLQLLQPVLPQALQTQDCADFLQCHLRLR